MLSSEQIKSFNELGFIRVPDVLLKEHVAELRSKIQDIFQTDTWKKSPYNTNQVLSDVYNFFPELLDQTLNSTVAEIVKDLVGENPILMPETAIHYSFYTSWHKDTTSLERAGNHFHLKPDFNMIQVGFYLQDNDEYGGGLTVMPKSANDADSFVDPNANELSLMNRIKNKLGLYNEEKNFLLNPNKRSILDIESKAGDLVIFKFKTNHRATFPRKPITLEQIPNHKKKIAFFNAFSVNNETAEEYLNYIYSRPEPFYQNLKSRTFHPDYTAHCEKLGIIVK
jgi:hypothetical protein